MIYNLYIYLYIVFYLFVPPCLIVPTEKNFWISKKSHICETQKKFSAPSNKEKYNAKEYHNKIELSKIKKSNGDYYKI